MCRTTAILAGSAAPIASKPTVPPLLTEQSLPETLAIRNVPYTVPSAPVAPVLAETTPSWSGEQTGIPAATLALGSAELPTPAPSTPWPLLADGLAEVSGAPPPTSLCPSLPPPSSAPPEPGPGSSPLPPCACSL